MFEKSQSYISKVLFKIEDIQSAILMKMMLDSLGRIASYSGDIAEDKYANRSIMKIQKHIRFC